jgi:tetratricopeptide (TPR) repeat protein
MRAIRCLLILCCCVAAGACATRKATGIPPVVTVPPAVPRIDVDALIRQGCFRCLERAFAAAEGERVFEVAALLTLRAKELGLPYAEYRRQAAAAAPVDPAFATYLAVLDAAAVDQLSGDRYLRDAPPPVRIERDASGAPVRPPTIGDRAAGWRNVISSGPGSELFRRYLDLVIAEGCGLVPQTARTSAPELAPPERDIPLLRYRIGLCGGQPEEFRAFRDATPEFVDADYTLARIALAGQPADLDEALRRVRSASEAFPQSAAIGTVLGAVYDAREEWSEALAAYEAVIAQLPRHRDALLGRTVALSHLARHDEAIATATQMIELGEWLIGEAYYWRAWNEFSLQRYPVAREDTDRAKARMVNAAVFVLSGLVEWNLLRLPGAEGEFEEAMKMDFGRCDAARFLGRVRVQRTRVPEALAAFKQAIQCFDLSIAVRRKLIADIQAGPGSEATRARLAASHQRAIEAATSDRADCQQRIAELESRASQKPATR